MLTRPPGMTTRGWIAATLLAAGTLAPRADARGPWDPPADYYASATASTGPLLQAQLRAIIRRDYWNPASTTHRVRSYDAARFALQLLHQDPSDPARIILFYSGLSVPGAWDAGVTWNREHTWPTSRGIGTSGPDYSDLHSLRPCNPTVNNARGNSPFGIGGGYWDPQASTNPWFTGVGSRAFDPAANDRGEAARTLFYMETRYDGADTNTTNLVLVPGMPTGNQMGDLTRLLEWHYSDPVRDAERRRNHLVFSNTDNPLYYQGNRNPFVDHPEYVWAIWGTEPNNSTIRLADQPLAPDGSSAAEITFRLIAGTPDARPFTISKTGSTPTTYDMIVSGPFLVAGAGRGLAFTPGFHSETFWVAPASVETPGIFTGAIIIDNTDLTSAGSGMGSADNDDHLLLRAEILSRSNPSFAADADSDSVLLASQLSANTGLRAIHVPIHNYAFSPTQARMDIDAAVGPDPPGRFGIIAGQASAVGETPAVVTLVFDSTAAQPDLYSASFIIHTSDEDIPGETADSITLVWNVVVVPPPACSGDANSDGFVNFADITTVLTHWSGPGPAGDADGDGTVGFADVTSVLVHWNSACP